MRLWIMLGVLALLGACAGSEDKEPGGQDVLLEDSAGQDAEALTVDLTGKVFFITVLEATAPTKELNKVWAKAIDEYNLTLLFLVKAHDPVAGTITAAFTTGTSEATEADGVYTLVKMMPALEPVDFTAKLTGRRFDIQGEVSFDIHDPTVNKPFHVEGITGYGVFSADGTAIEDCQLTGGIRETQAEGMCATLLTLGVVNFHWFMNLIHLCPDWDLDGDQTMDAYYFQGHLEAVERTSFYENTITPIVPNDNVKNCQPHTEECIPKVD
jgi:hypothetical protein